MKEPTFSICIPNYNYEKYLGATIESVLRQTYPHFEIIIVDNASTDRSFDIASSYSDSRIRLYRNEYNVGFAPNLQLATSYATMDFVNLLSSDDIMNPNALEMYASIINNNLEHWDNLVLASDNEVVNSDGIRTGFKYFDTTKLQGYWSESEKYQKYCKTSNSKTEFNGIDLLKVLAPELNTLAGFLTIVYSRKLWKSVAGYNAIRSIGPDKYFNYKLLLQNPKVVYVNEPLFKYRFHGSTNIKSYFSTLKQQLDDYLNVLEFGDIFQKDLGINKNLLVKNYLNRFCFGFSISNIKNGRYLHAFRTFFFSLASFPIQSIQLKKFYLNMVMLLILPVTVIFIRLAKALRII